MIKDTYAAIIRHNLVPRGSDVLIAVSGGADSTALLHVLDRIAGKLGATIRVAHLNHRLRGKSADEDAEFVGTAARKLGLSFHVGSSDVRRRAQKQGISIEMAARDARYNFLCKTARKCGAGIIATAHNTDDQAETVLLKLCRGAGPAGLSGISRDTTINGVRVVRPLLDISRKQILAFLQREQIDWREDISNTDTVFLRNRVRREIIPFLEERLNPSVKNVLARTAEIVGAENRWMEEYAADILTGESSGISPGKPLEISKLSRFPLPVRRRILRRWLVSSGVSPSVVTFSAVSRIMKNTDSCRTGAAAEIGQGWKAVVEYGRLVLRRGPSNARGSGFRKALNIPGETILEEPGLRIAVSIESGISRPGRSRPGSLPARATVSRRAVGRRGIYVRNCRPGDRIKPMGLKGSKKLQDILVDGKVPRSERGNIPVFTCGKEIIWIPGYRVAGGWESPGDEETAVQLYVERIGSCAIS